MGDNCYPFLLEMARESNITIMVENLLPVVQKYAGQFAMDRGEEVHNY